MCLRTARSGRVRGFDARDLCSGLRWHPPLLSSFRPTEEGGVRKWGTGSLCARIVQAISSLGFHLNSGRGFSCTSLGQIAHFAGNSRLRHRWRILRASAVISHTAVFFTAQVAWRFHVKKTTATGFFTEPARGRKVKSAIHGFRLRYDVGLWHENPKTAYDASVDPTEAG